MCSDYRAKLWRGQRQWVHMRIFHFMSFHDSLREFLTILTAMEMHPTGCWIYGRGANQWWIVDSKIYSTKIYYCLGGAEKPFAVQTDHKNLAYIQSTKRLNSHQAWCTMFFSCFHFILTYCPGSRKIKPDALSCDFAPVNERLSSPQGTWPED